MRESKEDIDKQIKLAQMMQAIEQGDRVEVDKDTTEYFEIWQKTKHMNSKEYFNTDEAWDKMKLRFSENNLLRKKKINRYGLYKYAIAASIILLIGIYKYYQTQAPKLIVIENIIDNATEEILPDGTIVFLNKGTQISYNNEYSISNRDVYMLGEAYFEVTANENLPFKVSVKSTVVKVFGTSFNVKFNSTANEVEVIVNSGIVQFYNKDNAEEKITLTKNDKGVSYGSDLSKSVNDNYNYLSWKNRKLTFIESPLFEVVADINSAYHSKVKINDSEINELLITATYSQLTIKELVESICYTFDLSYEINDNNYILMHKQ